MSPHAFDVSATEFQEKVLAASRHVPVLVDFWAEWCAPCRQLKPVLEKLAAEYGGRFLLAKINSDQNQELAGQCGVRGIPNVKAFVGGHLVDEFTGALPEAQVRAFIDKLLPSPAEPLRVAAREARASGEAELALSLLDDALQADPSNEAVQLDMAELRIDAGQLDAARALLDALEHTARDGARLQALRARLRLVAAGGGADTVALQARIATNGDDLDARLQLANALALAGDYRAALEHLLAIVRRDRKWQDEAARKAMLDLFSLLGGDAQFDDLVREFRIALARTLN
ncbi:MAG: tetratricopeptide repeat protein [Rhodocyclales bacterium]|nr:tetratricopeptide repeat protein [Rhodocyclales bacterium]